MSATNWIKIRISLPEDPAVIQIADALGIDEDEVVGKLIRVWGWADQHVGEDGIASLMNTRRIDKLVMKDGFAEAMIDAEWLAEIDGGMTFPNYSDHNGPTAKGRGQAAKRQQASRFKRSESATQKKRKNPAIKKPDKLPQFPEDDPDRCKAINAIERLMGKGLSAGQIDQFDQWAMPLPEAIEINDKPVSKWLLIDHAAGSAIQAGANVRSQGGALKYLRTIIDRCIREGLPPGEFEQTTQITKARKSAAKADADSNVNPTEIQI